MTDMTFDNTVKRHKAVDWLMRNDYTFVVLMDTIKQSPFNAVMVMSDWSGWIESRVEEIAKGMHVTEQERVEGYPLPKVDTERLERALVRMNAGLSP
jgi:hypothetical protein